MYNGNKAFILSHALYKFNILLACESIINCSRGSQCKVDETVHQAYCEPSCDLNNGGCADNEVCSLQQQHNCTGGPCPPVVQCLGEYVARIFVLSNTTMHALHCIQLYA